MQVTFVPPKSTSVGALDMRLISCGRTTCSIMAGILEAGAADTEKVESWYKIGIDNFLEPLSFCDDNASAAGGFIAVDTVADLFAGSSGALSEATRAGELPKMRIQLLRSMRLSLCFLRTLLCRQHWNDCRVFVRNDWLSARRYGDRCGASGEPWTRGHAGTCD